MTLHVAFSSPIDKWPLRDRSAPPAPVRKLAAARMRAKNPEACACTAIAADLRRWRVTGNGARSAMAAAACIADIVKGRRAENLEAPCARGIAAQLGLDVSSLTASRALSLLAAGPLAGFYVAGKPHSPARLLLADLVAAGAAVTPTARVRLPLSIPAVSGITPASSGSEPAAYPKVRTPRNRGTQAVVNKAPLPPKNPDQARALLPAGAQVARTFELIVGAWRVSPAWGAGSVADVARSLAPDELWAGQEQLQRALRSMVRVGVLRYTEGGLEFAWQRWRGGLPAPTQPDAPEGT